MSSSELACTYAALILNDDGVEITADQIMKLCKAANVKVESYWPTLFAKYFQKKNVDELISGVGVPGAGSSAAAPAAAGGAAPVQESKPEVKEEKKEEKKKVEEEEEDEDADMGFSLFD